MIITRRVHAVVFVYDDWTELRNRLLLEGGCKVGGVLLRSSSFVGDKSLSIGGFYLRSVKDT